MSNFEKVFLVAPEDMDKLLKGKVVVSPPEKGKKSSDKSEMRKILTENPHEDPSMKLMKYNTALNRHFAELERQKKKLVAATQPPPPAVQKQYVSSVAVGSNRPFLPAILRSRQLLKKKMRQKAKYYHPVKMMKKHL